MWPRLWRSRGAGPRACRERPSGATIAVDACREPVVALLPSPMFGEGLAAGLRQLWADSRPHPWAGPKGRFMERGQRRKAPLRQRVAARSAGRDASDRAKSPTRVCFLEEVASFSDDIASFLGELVYFLLDIARRTGDIVHIFSSVATFLHNTGDKMLNVAAFLGEVLAFSRDIVPFLDDRAVPGDRIGLRSRMTGPGAGGVTSGRGAMHTRDGISQSGTSNPAASKPAATRLASCRGTCTAAAAALRLTPRSSSSAIRAAIG